MAATTTHGHLMQAMAADPLPYFERMLADAASCGLDGIELAPEAAGWTGAARAYGSPDGVRRALGEHGLALSSSYAPSWEHLAPPLFNAGSSFRTSADQLARHAEFVRSCGATVLVMGTMPREHGPNDAFNRTDRDLARRTADLINDLATAALEPLGMSFALHTDAYSICSRNDDIAWMMQHTDPKNVGLCPDVGHILLDGGDPVAVLNDHIDRIPIMHWKDCTGPLDGSKILLTGMERHDLQLRYFRVLGDGIADWESWQRVLADALWSGWAHAEIDMSPDPVAEIQRGLAYFDRVLAPIHR